VNARREPVPKAPEHIPEHVFAANRYGPRDHNGRPTECLFTFGGKHCQLLPGNAVHKTSEQLAEALPPKSPDDRSDEMIGERDG
jgi:hypothetical protein